MVEGNNGLEATHLLQREDSVSKHTTKYGKWAVSVRDNCCRALLHAVKLRRQPGVRGPGTARLVVEIKPPHHDGEGWLVLQAKNELGGLLRFGSPNHVI